jgi:alkylhydroperoxidase/carboxymuconolactone decarboxylase family protein YurZ
VRLSGLLVLGRWQGLAELRRAAPPGEPDREWREAVLQSHLFAGFPRLVEAYEVLAEAGGLGTPSPEEGEEEEATDQRGAALFERIYADKADGVRGRLASFHPDYHRWVASHAYGRVLSRPGLSAAKRELCAVAALLALGQDRQLASHARGALRCGASADEVQAVPDTIADLVTGERLQRGRTVISHFGGR